MTPPTLSPRRFARFSRAPPQDDPSKFQIPASGMCLSAFLLIHPVGNPERTLLGRMRPGEAWFSAGALDEARSRRIQDGWMLPSRQLAFYESPEEAAQTILAEQLPGLPLVPRWRSVASEAYPVTDSAPDGDLHWDLHFLYDCFDAPERISAGTLWQETRYFSRAERSGLPIARGHGDILALAEAARPQ
ncbi:MAG: hypothetical protein ACYCPV_00290 [Thermoplasmata archaeon]